jgi:Cu+-exporting ATPase
MSVHSHSHHDGTKNGHACCAQNDVASLQSTIDPVCGMTVDPASTPHHATHDGKEFHFCSASCREKFIAEPAKYVESPRPDAAGSHSCGAHTHDTATAEVTDPVCGMKVDPAKTPHHAMHADHDYHFCSARCREKFIADPKR